MEDPNPEIDESSEIRNYLDTFQKEIQYDDDDDDDDDQDSDVESADELYYLSDNELDPNNMMIHIKEEPDDSYLQDSFEGYTYQMETKKDPQPYKGAEIIRLGRSTTKNQTMNGLIDDHTAQTQNEDDVEEILPTFGEDLHIDEHQTLEMVAKFAEEAVAKAKNSQGLESGDSYQMVKIVPSDTNPGELSYVLFVSDGNDDFVGNDDLSVYDLSEIGPYGDAYLSKKDIKMRTIRLASRRTQLANQQHMCIYCNYTSPKRYLLSRHMKSHSDERPHKCGVCERGFKTLASLQNHVNTHTGTRPHPCKDCDSCFTTSGELVRHVRYKHTHEKPHKCTECDYASVELSKLKRHMRCHTGERPYQCPHCTYASPDTYKLKRHLRIHTGEKPYECDICQSRFTQSNSLKAHKLIHSGNKPVFKCEYCPATCGRKTDLRIHMEKLHSNDKPHRCKRCGKIFLDRYSYKIHVRSHDGEKCFKCDLCSYASISQRHLETHMLVHLDQKPFNCDECDQSFRQKQLLRRHKNLYHDPNYIRPVPKEKTHICTVCKKAFRHKGNLIRHYSIHDPDPNAEKNFARNVGSSKEHGEGISREEEEDEEDDDLEYLNGLDDKDDDKHVVVFEVIQLPQSKGATSTNQTITMVDGNTLLLNGDESQEYSIIQPVEDENGDFINFQENVSDSEDIENISSLTTNKRSSKFITKSSFVPKKNTNKNLATTTRRRGRPPKYKNKILKDVADKAMHMHKSSTHIDDSFIDEKSILLREKEIEHARDLQIQKDFDECFGFNDKDDDILSTSTFHGNLVDEIS